jgi:hypothetical protein
MYSLPDHELRWFQFAYFFFHLQTKLFFLFKEANPDMKSGQKRFEACKLW